MLGDQNWVKIVVLILTLSNQSQNEDNFGGLQITEILKIQISE